MDTVCETDALIIGGGPAGASAALSLLSYTDTKVTLIEQSNLDRIRVGEHVSASIFDLLKYLKLDQGDFEKDSFTPTYSNISYWGSDQPRTRDSIFTTEEASYQLDREQFDLTLIQKVAERGGTVFPRTKCIHFVQQENKYWEVTLKHPEQGEFTIKAKFLLDATGRQASICRQVGVTSKKYDQLIGVGNFLKYEDGRILEQHQILETAEMGWWYYAALPNDVMTLTFFSDADIISKHQLHKTANWNQLLHKTRQIKNQVKGASTEAGNPWFRNAFSQISYSPECENFLAIGDAAASFDPISSMGIGFAMTSAFQAASIVPAILSKSDPSIVEIYQQDIVKNFENYLSLRKQFYQKEKRWPDSDFWKRRSC